MNQKLNNMDAIKFKYKGYAVELHPLKNVRSNYNLMFEVSKDKVLLCGFSIKNSTPLNEIIEEVERVIKQ